MQSSAITAYLQLGQVLKDGSFQPFGIKESELDVCSYALIREVNETGKIGTDLCGGNISFVSTNIPTEGILEWGMKPNKYYSGYIHFRDDSGASTDRLFFKNAACVNLKISFESEGSSYLMVQGALQAEELTLGNAGTHKNYWLSDNLGMDNRYNVSSEARDNFMGVSLNPEASLSAWMRLNGADYELRSFEMEFAQEISPVRGEPQSSVRGGFTAVSLFNLPDDHIKKWILGPNEAEGEFRFGDPGYGYPLKINFSGARCAGSFAQCMNHSSQNTITRLNITHEWLSLNGVEYGMQK